MTSALADLRAEPNEPDRSAEAMRQIREPAAAAAQAAGGAVRVLYIEGFSPGPGLPFPLLGSDNFEVISARMPYELWDILTNAWVVLLVAMWILVVVLAARLSESSAWQPVLVVLVAVVLTVPVKRRAVWACLSKCMDTFQRKIAETQPDLIVGYSWGGGIAVGLLARGAWMGPTLLLAPAGKQMWAAAGRRPLRLADVRLPAGASVMTVQGDLDAIVLVDEVRQLHDAAPATACRLLVVPGGDHFLRSVVTRRALVQWSRELVAQSTTLRGGTPLWPLPVTFPPDQRAHAAELDRKQNNDPLGGKE